MPHSCKKNVYNSLDTPGCPAADFSTDRGKELPSGGLFEVRIDVGGKRPANSSHQDIAGKVKHASSSVPDEKLSGNSSSDFLERPGK